MASSKAREQELNDEGFEETQSLVSESLSQEASSGNYETDTHDSTRCSPAELTTVVEPQPIIDPVIVETNNKPKPSPLQRRGSERILGRTKSVDKTSRAESAKSRPATVQEAAPISNFLKRGTSLRRQPLKKSLVEATKMHEQVERSGSRSSLRSSRSSLNSAASINTVKNANPQMGRYTLAIRALTNDLKKGSRVTAAPSVEDKRKNFANKTPLTRIPASRSSSSGSSIGPAARNVKKTTGVR